MRHPVLAASRAPLLADLNVRAGAVDVASITRALPSCADARNAAIAALLTYVARAGEGEGFDLALVKQLPAPLVDTYATTAPFRVDVALDQSFDALKAQVAAELAQQEKRGWYARDVITRYAALRNNRPAPLPIAFR